MADKVETEPMAGEVVMCNKCGGDCRLQIGRGPEDFNVEGCHVKTHHGYGSMADGMMTEWRMCDKCLLDLFKTFNHKPEMRECDLMTGQVIG